MSAHIEFFNHWQDFSLPDEFVAPYKDRKVPWGFGDLSYITYKRSYARPLDLNDPHGPTEVWWETCKRVVEGTISTYLTHDAVMAPDAGDRLLFTPGSRTELMTLAKDMFDRMFNMKWLPPGRGLFAMGTSAMRTKGAGCLNNCMFVSTSEHNDLADTYRRLMDFSMLGVGVGFDVRGAGVHTGRAPHVDGSLPPYIVEDTREGWCDIVYYILDAVTHGGPLAPGYKFLKIRPQGTPLRTFGGTASGPEPLINLVVWLLETFGCEVTRYGLNLLVRPRKQGPEFKFDELLLLDIGTQIGNCVVMGGIRRTALICIGDKDGAIPTAKHDIGDKLWRYRSNNSVIVEPGDDYTKVAAETQKYGEPGYLWLTQAQTFGRMCDPGDLRDQYATGTNPCVEQTLFDNELCCLVETFPARHATLADFEATLRCAYLYAKAVTLLPTHDAVVNSVIAMNRRMGVSLAGVVQAIDKFGRDQLMSVLDSGYQFLRRLDKDTSALLGVNESIKLTSVKPGGTVPLLPGATPGMHWDHAAYYIRRERFSSDSKYLNLLRDAGYQLEVCEDDPSAVAVSFLVSSNASKCKPEVSAREQLQLAADLQHWWADNQVSVTVHFRPEEDLLELLQEFDTRLKGVSFIPYFDDTAGDMPYKQLPYETISKETYDRMLAAVTPVSDLGLSDGGHDVTDAYCDSDACKMRPV